MADKTIFQKIIDREIPATIVYEDDISIAFLDIAPVSDGHTLLVSKEVYEWMDDVPDELLGQLFIRSKKLVHAMRQGLGCDFVQISVVGKDVPHFHIHLMPRYLNDGLTGWKTKIYENAETREDVAEKIRRKINSNI